MVELMVALTLSLILTLVVGQVYVSNNQAYRLQEAQSRIQENGRFALEFLAKDVRRVGGMGCLSVENTPLVIANSSPSITPATSIMGYDATQTSTYPVSASSYGNATWNPVAPGNISALAGTDILSIQFAEPCGGHLQTPVVGMTASPSFTIPSSSTCSIQVATELVLSDCSQIEVFRADSVSPITISSLSNNNTQDHFTYSHNEDAEVMLFHAYTYFIQPFNSEPTLYRMDNAAASPSAQPLIEGIEDMQLLYGIDLNSDLSIDQYVTAGAVGGLWANVIALRVDLVLRSTGVGGNNLTTAATACNGVAVTDSRLRRCYSFTINLRNPRA